MFHDFEGMLSNKHTVSEANCCVIKQAPKESKNSKFLVKILKVAFTWAQQSKAWFYLGSF